MRRPTLGFADLHRRLIEFVRLRIQRGEFTERSLARRAGLSQPHLHNALKGARNLSVQSADALLHCLRIGVADLLASEEGIETAGAASLARRGAASAAARSRRFPVNF